MRARLYLDVDGVINFTSPGEWMDHRRTEADGWTINYSPTVLSELMQLAREFDMEIVWTTTWEGLAASELAPSIGFGADYRWLTPPLGASAYDQYPPSSIWWKYPAVREDSADGVPFIWVDDELGLLGDWLNNRSGGQMMTAPFDDGTECLLLNPKAVRGIQPPHLDRMRDFLERLPNGVV